MDKDSWSSSWGCDRCGNHRACKTVPVKYYCEIIYTCEIECSIHSNVVAAELLKTSAFYRGVSGDYCWSDIISEGAQFLATSSDPCQ